MNRMLKRAAARFADIALDAFANALCELMEASPELRKRWTRRNCERGTRRLLAKRELEQAAELAGEPMTLESKPTKAVPRSPAKYGAN
jgi:hypothetical protein